MNYKVGVIVPPANPTVEPEMAELLPRSIIPHTTRFPVYTDLNQQERNAAYLAAESEACGSFGSLDLSSILIACTGSHYLLTPSEDEERCNRLSDEFGIKVTSSTLTITDTLQQLGIGEIVVASPYEDWLTDLSEQYWKNSGFSVSNVVRIRSQSGYNPYDVTAEVIVKQVEAAGISGDATVLFTGTGMPTLDALDALGRNNNRKLLSSNLCGARWILETEEAIAEHPQLVRLQTQIFGVRANDAK